MDGSLGFESAAWHYPPDFMSMMINTVPLLVRTKSDLIAFFRGSGVNEQILSPIRTRVASNREAISKYEITRLVLHQVNDLRGDEGLRVRREIVKRVTQFTAFDTCYENNSLKARGAVKQVSDFVRDRDTATRIHDQLQEERSKNMRRAEEQAKRQAAKRQERESVRRDLSSLFSASDPSKRGKALETILNRLFKIEGVSVKEAFTLTSPSGIGVVEQIDGVIEIDGESYLVEMKWLSKPLGVAEVSEHMTRVFGRAQSRGIFIVQPGYAATAVEKVRESLRQAVFVLCDLSEVVAILETDVTVVDWLRPKIRAAINERDPFRRFMRQ